MFFSPSFSPPPTLPQAFPPSKGEVVKASLGLANKNPVQALYELCAKNCWTAPAFLLSVSIFRGKKYISKKIEAQLILSEYYFMSQDSKVSGSQRVWQMSVKVCDKTFKAEKFNPNKGEAKTDAARACLNTMGIILDEN